MKNFIGLGTEILLVNSLEIETVTLEENRSGLVGWCSKKLKNEGHLGKRCVKNILKNICSLKEL